MLTVKGGVKMELSKRKMDILRVIIEDYMKTAEPIGSKALCDRLSFSSATIRNEMSELEALGLLEKPHTSAGRIPSDLGYRFYVDNLISSNQNLPIDLNFINQFMNLKIKELDKLILDAGNLISKLTNYTTLTLTPHITKNKIKKFDINYVDDKTFVIILITDNNSVKTEVIKSHISLFYEEVSDLANIVNQVVCNVEMNDINIERLDILYKLNHLNFLIDKINSFILEACEEISGQKLHLGGESNILNYPEYHDSLKAKHLIDFISNKDMIKFAPCDNVNVRIGFENGNNPLSDASVVYATYSVGNGDYGVIGVVGPKRMDYQKVSSYLALYAKQLSKIIENSLLNSENDDGGLD